MADVLLGEPEAQMVAFFKALKTLPVAFGGT
jgi:hypothetical protein